MTSEGVRARLAALGALYVPETLDEARVRLAAERPPSTETFAELVQRRLDALRALDELTRHLQRRT